MPGGWKFPEYSRRDHEPAREIMEVLDGKEYRPFRPKAADGTTAMDTSTTPPSLNGQVTAKGLTWTRGADVASAATITLPGDAVLFRITGTVAISTINGGTAGRLVALEFASAGCQVTAGTSLKLWGACSYLSKADSVLVLEHDGSAWREVAPGARSGASGSATGSSGDVTTTSNSYGDLTNMAITLTSVGGDLRVAFSGTFNTSLSGAGAQMALSLDGGAEVLTIHYELSGNDIPLAFGYRFTGVAAGSHTVKVRWKRYVSGSGTPQSRSDRYLLVEEVF